MNIRRLKRIGSKITGIKITNNKKEDTAFFIRQNCSYGVEEVFININTQELDNIPTDTLVSRGHNRKGLYLQALLHEIAHYKQYKRLGRENYITYDFRIRKRREDVADRYASRYYKKFEEVNKNV